MNRSSRVTFYLIGLFAVAFLLSLSSAVNAQSGLYNEAPMLAERVANGELPPVDDRMPTVPMIVQPNDSVGAYGGSLRVIKAEIFSYGVGSVIGYEPLVRWDPQWLRPVNNLAQSIDVSEDVTTFTIHLREGVRWSDGTPFTADDVLFAYQSILLNPEIRRSPPLWLRSGGEIATMETVDPYTLTIRFAAPNGLFLLRLANNAGSDLTRYPMHYLSQYLPTLNEDIDSLMEGFDSWTALFEAKTSSSNPDLPVLTAWRVVEAGETTIAERNPYYWKIDTDFNQLPYIDRVIFQGALSGDEFSEAINFSDEEAVLFIDDEFTRFSVYEADLEAFTSNVLISSNSTTLSLGLNLNHPNPTLQAAFGNKDVRIALSHAMNRDRIIADVFDGVGEAYQVAPRPESPFYNEQLAHQYTEYNVELSNQILDEAGYAERDADGFRLDSDGNRITFALEITGSSGNTYEILQHVVEDWQAVGIDVSLVVMDESQAEEYNNRLFGTAHDAYISAAVGGLDVILQPSFYFPFHPYGSFYASGWANWNLNPPLGMPVEPPQAIQEQMLLYAELQKTPDAETQAMLMMELLNITQEEFLVIGTVLDPDAHMLTSNNLMNVPALMPRAFDYPAPAPSNPAQYYIQGQGN